MDTSSLLQRARSEGTPLIDGDTATFLWRGASPPQLMSDYNDWSSPLELRQVAPQLWVHSLVLPRDAYLEYSWMRGKRRLKDPFNAHVVPNGLGEHNHSFYMPEGAPTPLALRSRGLPKGRLSRHKVPTDELIVGSHRTVHLYAPPSEQPCPLIVVLDGPDYLRRARLSTLVDNLIAQGRLHPLALAFVAHGGARSRFPEYACSEGTLLFLLDKVLSLARQHLHLRDVTEAPGSWGILGASLGGLMALYAGLRRPDVFGHVLTQSAAFAFPHQDTVAFELVRHGPVRPLRIWMDCGRYEYLREGNERMHALLSARGYDATYRAYNAGHNYPAWRNDVWRGLLHLYGTSHAASHGTSDAA